MADPIPAPVVETPTPPAVGYVGAGIIDTLPPEPPDTTVWWDVEDTVSNVLALLRFESSDVDVGRLTALVPAAGALLNERLDRIEPLPVPTPAPMQTAIELTTVSLYRSKDSALLDVVGTDPLADVMPIITPYRQRWGAG